MLLFGPSQKEKAMRRTYGREFKVQVCTDIRTGVMGWRESARHYGLDLATIGHWLKRYGIEECSMTDNEKKLIAEYEAKISALERKVGQLTMEVELLKKHDANLSRRAARYHLWSRARRLLHPTGV